MFIENPMKIGREKYGTIPRRWSPRSRSGSSCRYLGVALGPKSALEMSLAAGVPKLLAKVRKLTNGYFGNLVRFHNRYTGERVCEVLTPREFYLAQSLKRGLRYKEIAERMGIAQGRVRDAAAGSSSWSSSHSLRYCGNVEHGDWGFRLALGYEF